MAASAEGRPEGQILDLEAIAGALNELARHPSALPGDRRALSEPEVRRLVDGYAYVDWLLAHGVNPLDLGGSGHLLELNHRVLNGVTPERRRQYRNHLETTENHFYTNHGGGADAFYDWVDRNRDQPPRRFAAGMIVRMVSTPQLFLEGNQRTAALAASLVLVRGGLSPLVMTVTNAARLSRALAVGKAVDRRAWTAFWRLRRAQRALEIGFDPARGARFLAGPPNRFETLSRPAAPSHDPGCRRRRHGQGGSG
ncbi:MAG: hypothetical protein EA406_12055 [Rhodospirillales bacterium]|nr:MAG: hypothetical protein EA406_12055 [Rhodospirillales bacterium]